HQRTRNPGLLRPSQGHGGGADRDHGDPESRALMCNLYAQTKSVDEVARIFRELQMPLGFPDGIPNLQPRDIAITDPGAIVRRAPNDGEGFDLVVSRWSWPGAVGKPVYNFRSEGREFESGQCLIIADGF